MAAQQTINASDFPPGLIAVPAEDRMWTLTTVTLLKMQRALPDHCEFSFNEHTSSVAVKRNRAVKRMLKDPQKRWLLFFDSDMTAPRDLVHRLWAVAEHEEADLVQAAMVKRGPPHEPVGAIVADRGEADDPLRPFTSARVGVRSPLPGFLADREEPVELDMAGTGCLLVCRRVFDELEEPWFVADEEGCNEDYNFTLRATDAGFRCVLDPGVEVGHVASHAYGVEDARRAQEDRKRRSVGLLGG